MSKHTPGPWELAWDEGTWIQTEGDPYGHGVMHVADARGWGHLTGTNSCNMDDDTAFAIQCANARLIAAAPDLLAACEAALDALNELIGADYDLSGEQALCKAAIAKAKKGTN